MGKINYLIAIDLDGTLLPTSKKLPLLTKFFLRKLNKNGYKIVLASGRPTNNVKFFHNKLKLNTPIVSFNGLSIYHGKDNVNNCNILFNKDAIRNIVNDLSKKNKIKNIICATHDSIFFTNDSITEQKIMSKNFWLLNMKANHSTLDEILKHDIMNFIIEFEDKNYDQKKVAEILKKYKNNGICFWTGQYQGFAEIYDKVTNKCKAVLSIAKKMNIDKQNIFAFGNDLNDIEMIEELPNAYAMKNASDEIKSRAHLITKFDNDHGGVRKELKIILNYLKNPK